MKKLLFIFLLLATALGISVFRAQNTLKNEVSLGNIEDANGWWTLDSSRTASGANNVIDSSGGGFHGTESAALASNPGIDGQSVYIPVGEYINMGDVLDQSAGYTVSVWYKPLTVVYGEIVSKGNGSSVGWRLYQYTDGGFYWSTGTWVDAIGSSLYTTTNVWYHIVVVWTGSTNKIYINGRENTASSYTNVNTAPGSNASNLIIGRQSHNVNALIDDVRIYSRALSANEVMQLYQSTTFTQISDF